MRTEVVERGVSLEAAPIGSGLGLAIVGDVLEACGGSLHLEDSPLGGLRAVVRLPAVQGHSQWNSDADDEKKGDMVLSVSTRP
jgi:signal transduction histidine kinase